MWNDRLQFKEGSLASAMGFSGGAGGSGFAGPSLPDQQGMNNLQGSYNQLHDESMGNGPNPAQAQYFQNTQDLAKQQAGAISSVQGISPALAARMISQQGGGAMQNAAAAGATAQAQQQLSAMGMAAQTAAQQAGAYNQIQGNINTANQSLAQTQMNRGLLGGLIGSVGNVMAKGGVVQKNYADGGGVNNNNPFAFGNPQSGGGAQSSLGQFLQGTMQTPVYDSTKQGGMDNGPDKKGGQDFMRGVLKMFNKGNTPQNAGQGPTMDNMSGMSDDIPYASPDFSSSLMGSAGGAGDAAGALGAADAGAGAEAGSATEGAAAAEGGDSAAALLAKGGAVPAKVSPGEVYIPPGKVKQAAKSGNPLKYGKQFPGTPKVRGNSYANDVLPAKLQAGGIVIPNSIMQSKNPGEGAKRFIEACIAKGHYKGKASK